jgi:hypothetical protein
VALFRDDYSHSGLRFPGALTRVAASHLNKFQLSIHANRDFENLIENLESQFPPGDMKLS